jgi:hypothetical protein
MESKPVLIATAVREATGTTVYQIYRNSNDSTHITARNMPSAWENRDWGSTQPPEDWLDANSADVPGLVWELPGYDRAVVEKWWNGFVLTLDQSRKTLKNMMLPERIELSTSPLPRSKVRLSTVFWEILRIFPDCLPFPELLRRGPHHLDVCRLIADRAFGGLCPKVAFDAHLIGIDPDFRIHVSDRLLEIHDGCSRSKRNIGDWVRSPSSPSTVPSSARR